ncbi:MAG: photosynthetic complex assembly protein PuhC [Pseudomonadota bacterium]
MSTLHFHGEHDHEHPPTPLAPLLAAMSLVLISLLSVAWVRWFGEPAPPEQLTPVVAERQLLVTDLPGGLVEVHDAEDGELVDRFDVGEAAFARSTFRMLAHARQRLGGDGTTPFILEQRESGRLRLIDPITGEVLELWAYGPDNARAFATLLDEPTYSGAQPSGAATAADRDRD